MVAHAVVCVNVCALKSEQGKAACVLSLAFMNGCCIVAVAKVGFLLGFLLVFCFCF